jgi:hypothetical protein
MKLLIDITNVIVSHAIKMTLSCARYSIKLDNDFHLLLAYLVKEEEEQIED